MKQNVCLYMTVQNSTTSFHRTEFIITASCDGHIKFWKKQDEGLEFVKHFKAHLGENFLLIIQLHFTSTVLYSAA